jgi:hypothetical protein
MPESALERLAAGLLAKGLPRDYAQRLLAELEDHFIDLEQEHRLAGCSPQAAATGAWRTLGTDDVILAQVLARPELSRRHAGWLGEPSRPIALPAGAYADGHAIARWGASISLGGVLTASMLLLLANTIASGV